MGLCGSVAIGLHSQNLRFRASLAGSARTLVIAGDLGINRLKRGNFPAHLPVSILSREKGQIHRSEGSESGRQGCAKAGTAFVLITIIGDVSNQNLDSKRIIMKKLDL